MPRPLLIGQAPGLNTDPALPLFPLPSTMTGGRLMELMGVSRPTYLLGFDRINLLQQYPGRTGRDDKFPMRDARIAADALRPLIHDRPVVMVGRHVATAFGLHKDYPFHEIAEWGSASFAVVPHPSGRNHWYNKPGNRQVATLFWSHALQEWSVAADRTLRVVRPMDPRSSVS